LKDKDFRLVLVPLLSSMMIASGACYSRTDTDEYSRVCVDKETGKRVEDERCGTGSTGGAGMGGFYAWYFLSGGGYRSRSLPPLGAPVTGGSYDLPRGARVGTGRADSSSVRRGGFGSSSRGRVAGA
jgi:hypothetical protein